MIKLNVNEIKEKAPYLKAGDEVLLTGVIYTARDAAHKRLMQMIKEGKPTPFGIDSTVLYYAGPTPQKNSLAVGSCGPTTSSRMDLYTSELYDMGLVATIGKGDRNIEVKKSIIRNGSLYFCAIGGAGALASKAIKECKVVAFDDLGCESIKRLRVEDFPVFVGIDVYGKSIFKEV